MPAEDELSLVCVDHRLGGRTGLEFLESLRQRYPRVPSILFTGQASPLVEERAQKAGEVRVDVDVPTLISMACALSWLLEQDPKRNDRADFVLAAVAVGLRP